MSKNNNYQIDGCFVVIVVAIICYTLIAIFGCSKPNTPQPPQVIPNGITIIVRDTDYRIETSNRPRAKYVLDGEELHRWCPGDGVYYHIVEGGRLQIDTDHDGFYDYSTFLK